MKFSEIYGHGSVKETLKRAALTDSVGHAYIFEGPDGVGRFSTALSFASMLLCENKTEGEPCGTCNICRMCAAGSHPDVRIITNQLYDSSKKSLNILTDTIRSMKQEIYIKPALSDRKIYIIPEADTMNVSAQNSLLKILEEPPLYCIIIMLAQSTGAFLETVLSRSVEIRFSPLERALVEKYLIENNKCTPERASLASGMSGGSIGRALEILEDGEAFELRDETLRFFGGILKPAYRNMFDFIKFLKKNKSSYPEIFETIKIFCTDLLRISETHTEDNVLCLDKKDLLRAFSDKLSKGAAVEMMDILLECMSDIKQNVNYPAAVQMMVMDFWEVIHDRSNRSKI